MYPCQVVCVLHVCVMCVRVCTQSVRVCTHMQSVCVCVCVCVCASYTHTQRDTHEYPRGVSALRPKTTPPPSPPPLPPLLVTLPGVAGAMTMGLGVEVFVDAPGPRGYVTMCLPVG